MLITHHIYILCVVLFYMHITYTFYLFAFYFYYLRQPICEDLRLRFGSKIKQQMLTLPGGSLFRIFFYKKVQLIKSGE